MNKITSTLIATIAVVGFSACTAQQRQMVDNVIKDEPPAVEVVDIGTALAPQGSCSTGEHEIDGVCLPLSTDTPPPTQPPTTGSSCPAGEIEVNDPTPHCVPNPCPAGEHWVEDHCIPD